MIRMMGLMLTLLCSTESRAQASAGVQYLTNLSDALETMLPEVTSRSALAELRGGIDKNNAAILDQLRWAYGNRELKEGGYLIRIRTQEDPTTRVSVPVEGAELLGLGKDPQSALVGAANAVPVVPVASSLNARTHFLWITAERRKWLGYRLQYGPISDPAPLLAIQVAARADGAFEDAVQTANRGWLIDRTLENLSARSTQDAAAARAAVLLREHMLVRSRIAAAGERLRRTLANVAAADRLSQTLATMGTVLSLATMIVQVEAALPDMPTADYRAAQTASQLAERVSAYKASEVQSSSRHEADIRTLNDAQRAGVPLLDKALDDARMPAPLKVPVLY